jgi:hypothetical protein
MTRIATILSTGIPQYDQVFRGVYGTVEPGSKEDTVVFKPAPEFRAVSHLFTHMPRIEAPTTGVHEREIADEEIALAKAQLLFGLGARWNSMYSRHVDGGIVDGIARNIGTAALAGEMQSVAANVRRVLSESGLQVFAVPVVVKGRVERFGVDVGNLDEMIVAMGQARTIEVDGSQPARPLGTLALSGAQSDISQASAQRQAAPAEHQAEPVPRPGGMGGFMAWLNTFRQGGGGEREEPQVPQVDAAAAQPTQNDDAAQPPMNAAWASFRGIDAQVNAVMYVVAPDPQHAVRAVPLMVQAHEHDAAGLHLEPKSIAQVQDLQIERLYQGFDADPDFEDSGYGSDRPRY